MYHIYKSSIEYYRILNTETNEFIQESVKHLIIKEPQFKVNKERWLAATEVNFKNSGDPFDYFAYIESEHLPIVLGDAIGIPSHLKQIKFNPFRMNYFFEVEGENRITESRYCLISGISLFAE